MSSERTSDNLGHPDSSRDVTHTSESETPQKPTGKRAYLLKLQRDSRIIQRENQIKIVLGES